MLLVVCLGQQLRLHLANGLHFLLQILASAFIFSQRNNALQIGIRQAVALLFQVVASLAQMLAP